MNDVIYGRDMVPVAAQAAQIERQQPPASISAIIGRIEEAIETETAAITSDRSFDIRASNMRKSRHLYDLNRALKGVNPADLAGRHREDVIRLKTKLAANEAAILAHLNAVTEVAALIKDAIQHSENDGTYNSYSYEGA
jgi:putative heme degradation protein